MGKAVDSLINSAHPEGFAASKMSRMGKSGKTSFVGSLNRPM